MAPSWPGRPNQQAHDEALADGLRPGCIAIAVLFVVFAGWHTVDFEAAVATTMVSLALGTAVLAAGTGVALTGRRLPRGRAHLLAAALATVVYVNCVVQLVLTGDDHLTVNVLLLIVGVGVCLVDPLWVAGITGGFSTTWVVAVALHGPSGQVARAVADLTIGLVVAAMANMLRRRTLSRLLQAQAELRELSERCELTGLLNRRGFLEAAERRMAAGSPVTLWFIDVDGLKQVNDRHGHDVGDRLLLNVARALAEVFPDAVVARLSGDEFAVVEVEGGADRTAAQRRRLDGLLVEVAAETGLPAQVSTGTATSRPRQSLSEVLSAADAAMYAAKAGKRAARVTGDHPGPAGTLAPHLAAPLEVCHP